MLGAAPLFGQCILSQIPGSHPFVIKHDKLRCKCYESLIENLGEFGNEFRMNSSAANRGDEKWILKPAVAPQTPPRKFKAEEFPQNSRRPSLKIHASSHDGFHNGFHNRSHWQSWLHQCGTWNVSLHFVHQWIHNFPGGRNHCKETIQPKVRMWGSDTWLLHVWKLTKRLICKTIGRCSGNVKHQKKHENIWISILFSHGIRSACPLLWRIWRRGSSPPTGTKEKVNYHARLSRSCPAPHWAGS